MRVSIIGAGVVGQATGKALQAHGHDVWFNDTDPAKAATAQPFFPCICDAYEHAQVLLLCLPTPTDSYGRCDTAVYEQVLQRIVDLSLDGEHRLILQKSTLPPGSATHFARITDDCQDLHYGVNPEFLNAGAPLHDALYPAKVVVGIDATDEVSLGLATELYAWVPQDRLYFVTPTEAEFAKYANNLLHATLISFWNELQDVAAHQAALSDQDINLDHLAHLTAMEPGLESTYRVFGQAWGGACLPKDTRAFMTYARQLGAPARILEAVIAVNERYKATAGVRTEHWNELHSSKES